MSDLIFAVALERIRRRTEGTFLLSSSEAGVYQAVDDFNVGDVGIYRPDLKFVRHPETKDERKAVSAFLHDELDDHPDAKPARHKGGCGCSFCNRLKGRTISLDAWEAHHKDHIGHGATFTHERYDHPSGKWGWICCPCGAKILTHNLFEGHDERNDQASGT